MNEHEQNSFKSNSYSFDENELLKKLQESISNMKDGYSQWDIPETPSSVSDLQIKEANFKAEEIINSAKTAVINSYISHEETRLRQRKPLLYIVAGLTFIQMIAFNYLMWKIIIFSFQSTDPDIILKLFDIIKYYIGATVVELIGMLTFITTATFSSKHLKVMRLIFEENKNQSIK